MESLFLENRDYFSKRIQQLETSFNDPTLSKNEGIEAEHPETSVCVRVRPLTENEKEFDHIAGVFGRGSGVVNIYETRRKVNKKPELNVCQHPVPNPIVSRKTVIQI